MGNFKFQKEKVLKRVKEGQEIRQQQLRWEQKNQIVPSLQDVPKRKQRYRIVKSWQDIHKRTLELHKINIRNPIGNKIRYIEMQQEIWGG